MLKTILYILFGLASLTVGILYLRRARLLFKAGKSAERVLTPMQVFTMGIFFSVVLLFVPIYYISYDFGDTFKVFRPLLIAVHNAIRIFILDGDFDIIVKAMGKQPVVLRVLFSLYAAILYVLAPALTFTNVLSLFKNLKGAMRYSADNNKKHYIISELNERSVALAKSICNEVDDPVIVFTDVFEQNEEADYELLTQARDLGAICLKTDVSHLDIVSKKGDVEIFLIGNNEAENVSQAVKITTDLNEKNSKHNVKLFVFSSKPSAAYILDSVKYDNLLMHAKVHDYNEDCFKLRRIDEKRQLIWNTVPDMELFRLADRNGKKLSVLIAGFGSYGVELFKMLIWYCQFEDYKLKISIMDKREGYVESRIKRECPDLLKYNCSPTDPDAPYDIQIYSGVDATLADIDELLLYEGANAEKAAIAARLRETNFAFVSLGDDDRNIEVSIRLRHLFDRVNGIKAKETIGWKNEVVSICSVVFDDQKSRILYRENKPDNEAYYLVNHKKVPYHIHFIGGLSSQYDYKNIYNAGLEKSAYAHHMGWVEIEKRIHDEWEQSGEKDKVEAYDWYYKNEESDDAKEKARQQYEEYEYYRRSSLAKELYLRAIRSYPPLWDLTACNAGGKLQTCKCENCVRRKKNEHLRWNAYMRTLGFSYCNGMRADRALLHDNLCDWEQLSELDRQKD